MGCTVNQVIEDIKFFKPIVLISFLGTSMISWMRNSIIASLVICMSIGVNIYMGICVEFSSRSI